METIYSLKHSGLVSLIRNLNIFIQLQYTGDKLGETVYTVQHERFEMVEVSLI